jgi:hypothetical protein
VSGGDRQAGELARRGGLSGQPVDFSALAQPSLEQAQNVERTCGVQRDTLDDHVLKLFWWHIMADKRPQGVQ